MASGQRGCAYLQGWALGLTNRSIRAIIHRMSKRDYEAIAAQVSDARDVTENATPEYIAGWIEGVDQTARNLAIALAQGNPLFDRDRFLKACGVQS
jgi:2-keto-4-pentenoate hydratase/2-oxohepta-3-ene-1,7-dioic acid hydratase in catechol pathway